MPRSREGRAQRRDGRRDPVRLVSRRDDHDRRAGGVADSGGTAGIVPRPNADSTREGDLTNIEAHITGTVWKIEVSPGDSVDEGDTVVILESMKMEMPVEAEDAGVVKEISRRGGPGGERGRHAVV